MSNNIILSVGYEACGDYVSIPKLSFDDTTTLKTKTGNSRVEHVTISNKSIMKQILKIRDIKKDLINISLFSISSCPIEDVINMNITLYSENNNAISSEDIYVSSYCRQRDEQQTAREIINYINSLVS